MDLFQQFFGTNPQRQQEYADFVQRQQNDPNSISDEEAARRYREMMRNAPPELAAEANQHAFEQLPQPDRRAVADRFRAAHEDPNRPFSSYNYADPDEAADPRHLGQMAGQAAQQDPDLLEQLVGKDSPLNSTLGKAALAAGAEFLASRLLSGQSGGLSNVLGGQTSHRRQF